MWAILGLLLALYNAALEFSGGDPRLLAGIISEGIITSLLHSCLALVGLLLSLVAVYKLKVLPNWFKRATKCFSYLWVLFFPVGTIIGVIQIKRLNVENA